MPNLPHWAMPELNPSPFPLGNVGTEKTNAGLPPVVEHAGYRDRAQYAE
jgi:hypothetical protein